jgi:hypothetical protein
MKRFVIELVEIEGSLETIQRFSFEFLIHAIIAKDLAHLWDAFIKDEAELDTVRKIIGKSKLISTDDQSKK